MAYFLDLFSPETHEAFTHTSKTLSGFRARHRAAAERVRAGDLFVCYVTKVSRWCGLLEVVSGPFLNDTPLYLPEDDPFLVRFEVRPRIWLPLDQSLPIREAFIWNALSFTRPFPAGAGTWAARVRCSLVRMDAADGDFLVEALREQRRQRKIYPLATPSTG